MNYPNRIIKKGDRDKNVVKAIQNKLNEKGCGIIDVDGDFGTKTKNAVKLFQIRFLDQNGNPLKVDGEAGPLTWEALFGSISVPQMDTAALPMFKRVLEISAGEVGVMEEPLGSNGGPRVEEYLRSVGLGKGNPWCAAFVYWCFEKAAQELGEKNKLTKTGLVLSLWNAAMCKKIKPADAFANPSLIKPGAIFIIAYSGGTGHTGLVSGVNGGIADTIEGNTNGGGSREGIGVFHRKRKMKDINKGFLLYN